MNHRTIFIWLICSVMLFSCKSKPTETVESESGLIEITKAQFQAENMEFGEPEISVFSELVHFIGTIIPSVHGQAQINLPVPGLISRIYCQPGQFVNRGALLFDISGNEFIELQREFAESAVLVKRLKTEFDRVKQLNDENIGTIKELNLAESAFNAESTKYNALKIKLHNIGLDVSKIEGGNFYPTYSVNAPLKGYVNRVDATIGQYIQSQQNIAEIIDSESFRIKLSVFEKDIAKVETGQEVHFHAAGSNRGKYMANIVSVGKAINENTMSIDCFAEIENLKDTRLVSGQFIEGEIVVAVDSVLALPQSAIVSIENETFVLAFIKEVDNIVYLKKMPVKTGKSINDFIEISELPDTNKILVKGGYNIQVE